jgi:multiple sugar transport system ATP-binding protein
VVVMNGGRIEQIGAPQELYHNPRTRFVAGFIGSPAMNFIACRLEQSGAGLSARLSDTIALPVPASRTARYQSAAGKEVLLGLRPEHITEVRQNGSSDDSRNFAVTLDVVEPMGMETMVFFTINGAEYCGRVEPNSAEDTGASMRLHANMDQMHIIDTASGAVL